MKQRTQRVQVNAEEVAGRKARGEERRAEKNRVESPRPLMAAVGNRTISRRVAAGLPVALRGGIEELAGVSMAGVRVHAGSSAPAQHDAHSFTQGDDIHLGPGRDEDLPHEAWHVAQQRQGRVAPTGQTLGAPLNHQTSLEAEADAMGDRAQSRPASTQQAAVTAGVAAGAHSPVQLKCKICGAKSHNENKCPKNPDKKEVERADNGRGLTKANKAQIAIFHKILPLLDRENMYDEGGKSLVGGYKGKPTGLDKSIRIDRQMTGNVQFQIGDDSYAKVTFTEASKPGTVVAGLIQSLNSGEEVELP